MTIARFWWTILSVCFMMTEMSCNKSDDNVISLVKLGDQVPQFRLTLTDSTQYDSASQCDKQTLIVFFHTLCPDCQKELPVLQQLYDDMGKQFLLLLISREEPQEEIQDYWVQNNLTMPFLAQNDRSLFNQFATSGIPRGYIISRDRRVTYMFSDKDMPNLERLKLELKLN